MATDGQEATRALEFVGLEQRAKDWPSILSGGQRQRVALARALASKASILLLDEPLGALDALTRLEMQRLIEEIWLREKFTAVLVTHDVEEAVGARRSGSGDGGGPNHRREPDESSPAAKPKFIGVYCPSRKIAWLGDEWNKEPLSRQKAKQTPKVEQ